eukprot:2109898-Pyramimonas_sp.AAC.1
MRLTVPSRDEGLPDAQEKRVNKAKQRYGPLFPRQASERGQSRQRAAGKAERAAHQWTREAV